jgi:D-3-phosphoglycerate dehydrogenase/glyoxylate/hydroxypyruvate reductase A
VLVCTLPLTPATENLLDRARLSRLPRGAYLIQVGRGEQLVKADLRALLDEGHLAGAALDVYRVEPPPTEHWAWQHSKVFASPHIAGEVRHALVAATCLEALQALREGRQPAGVVDRAAGY